MRAKIAYSLALLERLWAAGKTHSEIAAALGCSENYVSQLVQRHNLPRRRQHFYKPMADDPTPEEIAERAKEIRRRNDETLRNEADSTSKSRGSRSRCEELPTIRCYRADRFGLHAM